MFRWLRANFLKKDMVILWLVIIAFLLSWYGANYYQVEIEALVGRGGFGSILVYILMTIAGVVCLPLSTFPILPVAAEAWGSWWAGFYSIIGWTIGAILSFLLAQTYGRPIIARWIDLTEVDKIIDRLPQTNIFWLVIGLRMILPVDVLSYALGLGVKMSLGRYILTTVIGIIPFAFIFFYTFSLSMTMQVVLGVCIVGIWLAISWFFYRYLSKSKVQ